LLEEDQMKRKFPNEETWISWMTEHNISQLNAQKYARLFVENDVDLDILEDYVKISRSISEGDACRLRKILRQSKQNEDISQNVQATKISSNLDLTLTSEILLRMAQSTAEPDVDTNDEGESSSKASSDEDYSVESKTAISPRKLLNEKSANNKRKKKESDWKSIVCQALEGLGGEGSCSEITSYIEDHFQTFIDQQAPTWRHCVANCLRTKFDKLWTQDKVTKIYLLNANKQIPNKTAKSERKRDEKIKNEETDESIKEEPSEDDQPTPTFPPADLNLVDGTGPFSWSDIIYQTLVALGGKASRAMIFEYIKEHYPHLIQTRRNWQGTLGGRLSANQKNLWTKQRIENIQGRKDKYLYVISANSPRYSGSKMEDSQL